MVLKKYSSDLKYFWKTTIINKLNNLRHGNTTAGSFYKYDKNTFFFRYIRFFFGVAEFVSLVPSNENEFFNKVL